jgi:hypothetical protein
MADERDPSRGGDYRIARVNAAGALVGVLVVLLLRDAFIQDTYSVDPFVMTVLVTAILGLLGIEAVDVVKGSRK